LKKARTRRAPSSYVKLLKKLKVSLENAYKLNHRRLLVLSGSQSDFLAILTAKTIIAFSRMWKKVHGKYPEIVYFYHRELPNERVKVDIVKEVVKGKMKNVKIEFVDFRDTEEYLGTTFDSLILDLTSNLKPNDIGRLIGIVRGGGLLILLIPNWDEWGKMLTIFQRELATPQHPENEVRQRRKF